MKRQEYFLYAKKIKCFFLSTIRLFSISPHHRSAIWRLCTEHKQRTLFCIHLNARMCILVYLRFDFNENSRAVADRRFVIFIFFAYKKYSHNFIKFQIEPLMANWLPWRCFSYFSGPWQCYLLGGQWDSHKPPGSYLKYLKLCSEDERSFYGVGRTCG